MKKRIIIGAVILLVVLYAFRVYKVNSEIRAVKEDIIPFGTEREVSNSVNMKINGYTVLSKEEAKEKYDYDLGMDEEVKIILVNVTYFSKTNKSKTVDTRPNSIEKTGYSTATEMEFYHICNSLGLEFELKGREEKEIILPYILFKFQFKPNEWEKIEDKEFYISNSRYPVKTKWMLK
ncbi:hypothetical protein GCWU000282_02913 [Catonella morbi ATCC 51271]|uniref:DUF4352 domain-containing protein n=1 Tax=Catonella morbi ATCC 51271 TaxID=592026 RepID=V2XIY1_9FIRM|nr:hypothetical protein [Catonella morbi]ESL02094.1 hypothetical protein GCWU000282_02913 [Catonella morbi ATCC 51271]